MSPEADPVVVLLFGLLHDAFREADGPTDKEHGARAADWARDANGAEFTLSEARLDVLTEALSHHTDGRVSTDPTIAACWDADRLSLSRYAVTLDGAYMSTDRGRAIANGTAPYPPQGQPPELGQIFDDYRARLGA
jgi:uncharacterized protein